MSTVRRSILATFAALAVVAAPAATHAAETYLALKGGVWAPTASDGISSINGAFTSGRLPASGDVELAYGATLGIIGAQIAGGYMWSSTTASNGVTTKVNAVPLYVLGQLRLPIFFIQPYLSIGVGGLANFPSGSVSGTKFSFLAIGGAGVDFILGPILLGAEARYMYVSEQTFNTGSLKLSGVNITANVGYVF